MKAIHSPYSNSLLWFCLISLFVLTTTPAHSLETPDGRAVVTEVEDLLWGKTIHGEYEMTITTPHWQRTLELKMWMKRPEKSFIRILSPAKEAGIGSLRIENEMWNYLPKVERTLKIPPSMMLQPWMGSDFSNDDLVKESSIINDYEHSLVATEDIDNEAVYHIESIPRPEAAVVWGKLVYRVRQRDSMPLSIEYFDERGRLIKRLSFSKVKQMGGRLIPTQWVMQPILEPEKNTTIRVKKVEFNQAIADRIFTLRNLRKTR